MRCILESIGLFYAQCFCMKCTNHLGWFVELNRIFKGFSFLQVLKCSHTLLWCYISWWRSSTDPIHQRRYWKIQVPCSRTHAEGLGVVVKGLNLRVMTHFNLTTILRVYFNLLEDAFTSFRILFILFYNGAPRKYFNSPTMKI